MFSLQCLTCGHNGVKLLLSLHAAATEAISQEYYHMPNLMRGWGGGHFLPGNKQAISSRCSIGFAFSRPKSKHHEFRKLHQMPSSPSWEGQTKSGHPCPSLASCDDVNFTMGCFLIMWTVWHLSNLSHAWYMPVLFPQFDSVVLDFSPRQGSHSAWASRQQCRETQRQLFCPSSPYDSSLPRAIWLLDGPVLSETKTNAVKCQRAKCAGSFHQPIVSRLQPWMERMWLTFKCTKDCRITCPYVIISQRAFVLILMNSVCSLKIPSMYIMHSDSSRLPHIHPHTCACQHLPFLPTFPSKVLLFCCWWF